jgi:arylsulfatase A-like enzyme
MNENRETTASAAARITKLAYLFPNWLFLCLIAVGTAAEAILLNGRPDNIYQIPTVSAPAVVLLLAAYWLTVTWLLRAAARGVLKLTESWPRTLRWAVHGFLIALLLSGLVIYLISWGVYFQVGDFLSADGVEFFLTYAYYTWVQILNTRPWDLMIIGALVLAALVGAPFFLSRLARADFAAPLVAESSKGGTTAAKLARIRSTRRATFYAAWMTALALLLPPLWGPGVLSVILVHDSLIHRLNPGVTLIATGIQTLLDESIEPCLDTAELQPLHPNTYLPPPASAKTRPNVLMVAIESMRWDVALLVHQGQEVMPNFNRIARQGIVYPHAYCTSTHSDYADPPIVASLYPLWSRHHNYYRASDPWPRTKLYDLLKPVGYGTAIISSENEEWGGKSRFYASPNLDLFEDAEHSTSPHWQALDDMQANEVRSGIQRTGSREDIYTANSAIAWITRQHQEGRPFFLYINFQDSHFPYILRPNAPRPFQPCELKHEVSFLDFPDSEVETLRNAYYNALRHVDVELGRVLDAIGKLGLSDNTIVVLVGDNGEAFNEGGHSGHAGGPFEAEVHIAQVIAAPGRITAAVDNYPTGHIDLAPIVLHLMGWPAHPHFQGIDVLAGTRPPADERLLFFHTNTPLAKTEATLLGTRWKYHHPHRTGEDLLFDLQADPWETVNVAAQHTNLARRLRDVTSLWRKRQLAYYHFPFYYQNYYPPQPPQWR